MDRNDDAMGTGAFGAADDSSEIVRISDAVKKDQERFLLNAEAKAINP